MVRLFPAGAVFTSGKAVVRADLAVLATGAIPPTRTDSAGMFGGSCSSMLGIR